MGGRGGGEWVRMIGYQCFIPGIAIWLMCFCCTVLLQDPGVVKFACAALSSLSEVHGAYSAALPPSLAPLSPFPSPSSLHAHNSSLEGATELKFVPFCSS